MRATVIHGPRDVRVEDVPDPRIVDPTDALVQVTAACVCGSDLWAYRGIATLAGPTRYGHEFVGVVTEVGSSVSTLRPGDFVIAPFNAADGTCVHCCNGVPWSCENSRPWGRIDPAGHQVDGGQGQFVRVPWADATLVATPDKPAQDLLPSLLTLTDVMATGHHAAVTAGVAAGDSVVVVGDGAVGLCGVLAARRLGAERIVIMSRHADRQSLARRFGATDVVAERGADGVAAVRELLGGGADAALECVGMQDSIDQAIDATRPGGRIGCVGVPHLDAGLDFGRVFAQNKTIGGGGAPVRVYLPELLADVLAGSIRPGDVFDAEVGLEQIAEGYAAMDERRSIKTLVRM